ncbi:MAG: hypothetical protein JJE10_06995 [Thermoleophilia bacterium]|nr:hypothetical protein [Thermoleophilia bacterium]
MNFQRVHPGEWLVAASGGLVLIGLLLPFSGGDPAFSQISLLDLLLLAIAAGGLMLPTVVARSNTTDVPITSETFLAFLATLAALILLLKIVWPPDGGLQEGFYLSLAGCLMMTVAGWKSVSRES